MEGNKNLSLVFFVLSFIALALATVVSFAGVELYLAGTQWTLVAIMFGIWAIYLK